MSYDHRGAISSEIDLERQLKDPGYVHVECDDLHVRDDLLPALSDLEAAYERLPLDRYCSQRNRRRRHSRFVLLPWEPHISHRPMSAYFQKRDLNPDHGGMVRKFEDLEPDTVHSPFLLALLDFDFMSAPFSAEDLSCPFDVGVHLVRVEASPGMPGTSSPDCLHKDGEPFTFIHLIRRFQVVGGKNIIADNDKKFLAEVTLSHRLETIAVSDRDVYHQVEKIETQPGAARGFRDVLLIDFTPMKPDLVN